MADAPPGLFDEDGKLILPDTSWWKEKFVPPDEPETMPIPSDLTRHGEAMWLHMGYSVAKDGPATNTRRKNLIRIYSNRFVPENQGEIDMGYLRDFGEPMSDRRFNKIRRYLSKQIASKKNDPIMKNAVKKWEDDREGFLEHVGDRHEIDAS